MNYERRTTNYEEKRDTEEEFPLFIRVSLCCSVYLRVPLVFLLTRC